MLLAMFSSSRGYLVSRCISVGMMSLSCSRRHCGLLSASWTSTRQASALGRPCSPPSVRRSCCYQYEGVEAGLFFLPVLDLLQSPRLMAAEPGGQLLEPLALGALELEHVPTESARPQGWRT